ncbi:MAG: hypothetical protein IT364_18485 [Candidatus Hydrogenedentes bacterium]|nr:hypothetical protein [Candidatus Hydrogenedentota bacterium]
MAYIDPQSLEHLRGSSFYYPCAGHDFEEPFSSFVPYIRDFWFVDIVYFRDDSALNARPLFAGSKKVKFVGFDLDGEPTAGMENRTDETTGRNYPFLTPCTRREQYEFIETGDLITVNRRRGFGEKSIEHVPDIGVFFHRYDSSGEGGSNREWLSERRFHLISERLRDGGVVATDGSLAQAHRFQEIRLRGQSPEVAFESERDRPFTMLNRVWTCIGWIGRTSPPTLVWKLMAYLLLIFLSLDGVCT